MGITAADVKKLREMTGAGMMDCKKVLTEADGDFDKAIELLREKGLASAQKKAGRIAAEGMVEAIVSDDEKSAALVEVNSETDFVAKNEKFRTYVAKVAKQALATNNTEMDAFMAEPWNEDSSKTVKEELAAQVAVIGENLQIRRFQKVEEKDGFTASYIHMGGKIGVIVAVKTDTVNDATREIAKNVAMQAAALKPLYLNRTQVDADYLEKEEEILTAAAKNEKPDANDKIIAGMVKGRINKELKEICLMDQIFIKAEDGKQSVQQYVDAAAKAAGVKVEITDFVRYETGEGLEKRNEDFASEVAAQMGN